MVQQDGIGQLLFLLSIAVGVLVLLLGQSHTHLKMTVSCAHKPKADLSNAMLERDILPTNVKPVHYDLSITPDMTNFVYDGLVSIQ